MSFSVRGGECLCISGPSGAGKSLLLRALADLIPHQGDMQFDGQVCSQTRPELWRRQVGLLAAESHWWADNVGDHFLQPNQRWFEQLGFSMEVLSWPISRCSTGEKQRLAILRLVCNLPKALLLDEPTASLDKENVKNVEAFITQYKHDFTAPLIWVSHDPLQIKRVADRHMVMDSNQLREAAA